MPRESEANIFLEKCCLLAELAALREWTSSLFFFRLILDRPSQLQIKAHNKRLKTSFFAIIFSSLLFLQAATSEDPCRLSKQ
jgi:hypothetical protein